MHVITRNSRSRCRVGFIRCSGFKILFVVIGVYIYMTISTYSTLSKSFPETTENNHPWGRLPDSFLSKKVIRTDHQSRVDDRMKKDFILVDNQRENDFVLIDKGRRRNVYNLHLEMPKNNEQIIITFPWNSSGIVDLHPKNVSNLTPGRPDFNGIYFQSIFQSSIFERQIRPNDSEEYEKFRKSQLVDKKLDTLEHYDRDPPFNETNPCRRNAWMNLMFPTCNTLHEVTTYDRPVGRSSQNFHYKYAGEGTFRQTYVFLEVEGRYVKEGGDSFAVKQLIYKDSFNHFVRHQLHIIPYEALIMERLTSSPRIANIYSYCGATNILESLPNEVNEMIQPGHGRANHTELIALDDVYPKNNLTDIEKVGVALDMAEAIADLHGFKDGVIVHGDGHIDQYLADNKGFVKLGDFNIAAILSWNDVKGEYCKIEREPWPFQFRAPEEIGGTPFDDKIDVFTMGNNIYSLVTGLRPFYDNRKAKEICAKILNGERGFIDPRYRNHSFVEAKLIKILDLCWVHNPEERVDIFVIVRMLRKLLARVEYLSGEQ